jgi:hypothetical protein
MKEKLFEQIGTNKFKLVREFVSPEWTTKLDNIVNELNAELAKHDDPPFESILLQIQNDHGLSDYETYLVGENSSYPTPKESWKTYAGGKFAKFAKSPVE